MVIIVRLLFCLRHCVKFIGVARGVHWVRVHPQGSQKFFGVIYSCKCNPQAEQEVNFYRTFLLSGED